MIEKEFNLLNEPWILVMDHNGKQAKLSVKDVFRQAHMLKSLAGELPTQDIAILRLLLAILHATFGRYDAEGNSSSISEQPGLSPSVAGQRWKTLWDKGKFPCNVIEKYLFDYEDRFWLFHPERPFYQVAALAALNDMQKTSYTASKLNGELSESSHKIRLFPQRTGSGKTSLDYDEAARWLIYVNAFDDAGGKPKTPDRPSPGKGWLGKLGLIIALGNNLFETLLLNFVLLQNGEAKLWNEEKPIWEDEQVKSDERKEIVMPDNASQLYTLQSRRLLLKRAGRAIIGYSLLGGDFFKEENAFSEQMTVWKKQQKKGASHDAFSPKRHDHTRQLWREFPSLVIQRPTKKRPGVVGWLAYLRENKLLTSAHFRFQIASTQYDTKGSSVVDVFSDSISFSSDLLTNLGIGRLNRIIQELATTDLLVNQLWELARGIAIAEGSSDGGHSGDAAREQAYYRLDTSFREWLTSIKQDDEIEDACKEWFIIAQRVVRHLGEELVHRSSPQAIIGHEITVDPEKKEKRLYSAPKEYNRFLYNTKNRSSLEKFMKEVKE